MRSVETLHRNRVTRVGHLFWQTLSNELRIDFRESADRRVRHFVLFSSKSTNGSCGELMDIAGLRQWSLSVGDSDEEQYILRRTFAQADRTRHASYGQTWTNPRPRSRHQRLAAGPADQ